MIWAGIPSNCNQAGEKSVFHLQFLFLLNYFLDVKHSILPILFFRVLVVYRKQRVQNTVFLRFWLNEICVRGHFTLKILIRMWNEINIVYCDYSVFQHNANVQILPFFLLHTL